MINYKESPPSRELNDSDYKPVPKKEKPLDNKRYPSNVRIAIQKNIELNKMMTNLQTDQENKQDNSGIIGTAVITTPSGDTDVLQSALPDVTSKLAYHSEVPVATSSPKPKTNEVKGANHTLENSPIRG